MKMEITSSIQDVNEKEWNALAKTDFPGKNYGWLKTVEESGMRDMSYVVVKESQKLVAAAVCYIYPLNIYGIRMDIIKGGCPLGSARTFFCETAEHANVLLEGLTRIKNQNHAQMILVTDFRKNGFNKFKDYFPGYIPFLQFKPLYIDLKFDTFEDYLQSLKSSDRRSIRKTLHRAEKRWHLKEVVTSEFSTWKDVVYNLQRVTCKEHNDFRGLLNTEFYNALEKNFKDHAELRLFFKDDIPLAFGLALNSSTISLHDHAGINPKYRKYQAYFLLYYYGIKRAIERGQNRIYFGGTTRSFKKKIGCTAEPLLGFASTGNSLLNAALYPMLKVQSWRMGRR
ncbi:MAG: GNAT family N-acetyltransferase [Candidatus Methanofastidiosia archaeon]|jgi:predicted N-acyltransferase